MVDAGSVGRLRLSALPADTHLCVCVCVYREREHITHTWAGQLGIATDYGLDGPGTNPGGDEISPPPRPALGPTQPPVKWVPGLSRGKVRPEPAADHSPPSSAAVMEE